MHRKGSAFVLHCILALCSIGKAGATVQIQAFPPDINVIDIKPLTIQCTYEPPANTTSSTQLLIIEYLSISKRLPSSGAYNILSELTASNPNTPTQPLHAQKHGISSVSGSISKNNQGNAHMSITWNSPASTDAGVYVCTAHTLNDLGIPISHTVEITIRDDSMLVIGQKMKSLQDELNGQQECCRLANAHLVEFDLWRKTISTSLNYFANNLLFNHSSEYENRTYAYSLFKVDDVNTAEAVCRMIDGYLAEINNADEWKFIQPFLIHSGTHFCYLIGGRDDVQENRWYWPSSNSNMTFAAWGSGEPNNSSDEDCLEICSISATAISFNDTKCRYKNRHGFICEIPKKN